MSDVKPQLTDLVAYALLITLAVIWSSSFAAIKIGVETMGPMTLAAVRIVLAAILLVLALMIRGEDLRFPPKLFLGFFMMGLLGNGLPFFLIGWGEQVVDSGLAAILMAVMPLATLALAHVFTHDEKLTVAKILGVLCGVAGVAVLVGGDALAGLGQDALRQSAIAGGALCYAIATIIARNLPEMSVLKRAALTMVFAAVQTAILAFWMESPLNQDPDGAAWVAAIYLGLFPTALATILYFLLISARGATFIAVINFLIPILGVVWGVLFLAESLHWRAFLALFIILVGIALATRKKRSTPEA